MLLTLLIENTCLLSCIHFFSFRVVWVFGPAVRDAIQDITPTRLTKVALSKLREADHIAQKILRDSGYHRAISQVLLMLAFSDKFTGSMIFRFTSNNKYELGRYVHVCFFKCVLASL